MEPCEESDCSLCLVASCSFTYVHSVPLVQFCVHRMLNWCFVSFGPGHVLSNTAGFVQCSSFVPTFTKLVSDGIARDTPCGHHWCVVAARNVANRLKRPSDAEASVFFGRRWSMGLWKLATKKHLPSHEHQKLDIQ